MSKTETLTYVFLKLLSKWFRALSHQNRNKIGDLLARIVYRWIPIRQKEALKNIQIAFPNKSIVSQIKILKKCYRYFMKNAVHFLAYPNSYHNYEFLIDGKEILDHAIAKDEGVIFITGHCGAWEVLISWLGSNKYPFAGVAAVQKNLGSNKHFQDQRDFFGVEHIFRSESIGTMFNALRNKKILGLVSDQDAGEKGISVSFFGQNASTPKGPAVFHLKTGAPLVFGSAFYQGNNTYHIQFQELHPKTYDIDTITQTFTTMLENKIKQYPAQYFWFHRRWKSSEKQHVK